jgi:hypothetical protein
VTREQHKERLIEIIERQHGAFLETMQDRNLFMNEAFQHAEKEFRRKEFDILKKFNTEISDLFFDTFEHKGEPS